MKLTLFVAACALAPLLLTGCETEHAPTGEQLKEQRSMKLQAPYETPHLLAPESRNVNEAQLVLNACGAPASQQVQQLRTNDANGPVFTMMYSGSVPVTLRFIPNRPAGTVQPESAPLKPWLPAGSAVPANTTWTFDDAIAENQEILTAKRLSLYLPCAAHALNRFE